MLQQLIKNMGLIVMLICIPFMAIAQTDLKETELYNAAKSELLKGNYEEAYKGFTSLIQKNSKNASYWYARGLVLLQQKNYSDAVVDLNKCIYLDTSMNEAYYNRFLAYMNTSNYQFALADVTKYLSYSSDDATAHLARYLLSLDMKEYDYSMIDAEWMLNHNLGGDTMKTKLISIYDALKKYDRKLDFLNNEIKQNPDISKYYYFRAMTYHQLEKYAESNTDISKFLMMEPENVDALKLKFDNLFFLKQFNECVELIQQLIRDFPARGQYYSDYGHTLLQMKQYKEAERKFTQAIKLRTENLAYVYLGRGIARYNLGKLGMACQDWDRSLMMGEKGAQKYLTQYCK